MERESAPSPRWRPKCVAEYPHWRTPPSLRRQRGRAGIICTPSVPPFAGSFAGRRHIVQAVDVEASFILTYVRWGVPPHTFPSTGTFLFTREGTLGRFDNTMP